MTTDTSAPKPIAFLTLFWKYRHIFLKYRGGLAVGILALVATNLLGIAVPWLIKLSIETLQHIANPAQTGTLYRYLAIILCVAVLMLASRLTSRIALLGIGRRIEFDLRNRLYGHLLTLPPAYYGAHSTGELMSRLTNDVEASKFLTGGGIMLGVNTILAYLTVLPMMAVVNGPLTLATFVLYPIVIVFMSRVSRKVRSGYYAVQQVLAEISTIAQENLAGIMVIQSYAKEGIEAERFNTVCRRYFKTYMALIHERITLFMILAALSGLSLWLVLSFGGMQVIAKHMDLGGFIAFTMYLERLTWPTMALGWTISIFQQGAASLARIDDVLSTAPPDTSLHNGKPRLADVMLQGHIQVQQLDFAYRNPYANRDSAPETASETSSETVRETTSETAHEAVTVLHDVSLEVAAGEIVALVGPVASGKSTLLRILASLHEIPDGHVLFDGHDLNTLAPEVLRDALVFMPQLSFLFSSTINQNIAFGRPDALAHALDVATDPPDGFSANPIQAAAQAAGMHTDILTLPQRYDTLVGERGLALSGGQRQRVSLARAILLESKMLLLDDPLSNVDADTERRIVDALTARKILHGRTTVFATHRFSLLNLADRIVLMDAGRVLAEGAHAQLLEAQPLYRKLLQREALEKALHENLGDWS